jgi:hypothetical protein
MDFVDYIQKDVNNINNIDEDIHTNIVNYYSHLIVTSEEHRQKYIDEYILEMNKEVDFDDPRIHTEINDIYFTFTDEIPNLFTHFCQRNSITNKNKRIFALGCYYYLVGLVSYTEYTVKGFNCFFSYSYLLICSLLIYLFKQYKDFSLYFLLGKGNE